MWPSMMESITQSSEMEYRDILKKMKLNRHCLRLKIDGPFVKKLSIKIGAPRFAMAQYTKVNRITFPLGNDAVILVTTELGIDIEKLVDRIIEISNPNNNNLLAGFYTR